MVIDSINGRVMSDADAFTYTVASVSSVSPLVVLRTGGTTVDISGRFALEKTKLDILFCLGYCFIL